eukprot:Ihof_evm13s64 gene=Ihof_evmTU13s64
MRPFVKADDTFGKPTMQQPLNTGTNSVKKFFLYPVVPNPDTTKTVNLRKKSVPEYTKAQSLSNISAISFSCRPKYQIDQPQFTFVQWWYEMLENFRRWCRSQAQTPKNKELAAKHSLTNCQTAYFT